MTQRTSTGFRGPELVGILLIALGVIFLLGNVGILRVTWGVLWPAAIIGLGVVVVLSALRPSTARPETLSIPRDRTERMELELRVGAGRFRLGPGAGPDQLVVVEAEGGAVDRRLVADGSLARVSLRQDAGSWPWFRGETGWRVGIADTIPTRIDLGAGAGEFVLDMLGLSVVEARIAVGAADLKVRLPRPYGDVPVRISAGAASVVIEVPAGVEAQVETSGLLSVEGPRVTPGYAAARDRVTVRVEGAAASVRIRGPSTKPAVRRPQPASPFGRSRARPRSSRPGTAACRMPDRRAPRAGRTRGSPRGP
jgi:hypothetical protein